VLQLGRPLDADGEVEAADEREAVEKIAKEFKVIANTLIAVQRRQRASG
jgi:hypothetical protein